MSGMPGRSPSVASTPAGVAQRAPLAEDLAGHLGAEVGAGARAR
jgi:hypothetical protein